MAQPVDDERGVTLVQTGKAAVKHKALNLELEQTAEP